MAVAEGVADLGSMLAETFGTPKKRLVMRIRGIERKRITPVYSLAVAVFHFDDFSF